MAATLDYLRLFRLPNVFTSVADVLAGFLVVRGAITSDDVGLLLGLCGASALLYTSGMVLNDVFDIQIDRQERPQRPLPSGLISLQQARLMGAVMLLAGVCLAALAPSWGSPAPHQPRGTALVALALAGFVLAYDGGMKSTVFGPLTMGACRGLNLLMGMSAVAGDRAADGLLGLAPAYFLLPLGITMYITGLTWFARNEASQSTRGALAGALGLLLSGLGVIAAFPSFADAPALMVWYLLIALLAASIARPFLTAIASPEPARVQAAIKHGILSLITIDAAIALYGSQHPMYAVLVVAMIFPARLLGQWVYST